MDDSGGTKGFASRVSSRLENGGKKPKEFRWRQLVGKLFLWMLPARLAFRLLKEFDIKV